ncbi:MAG TPA: FAD-binding oxidoreductase [Myxococcaceae bacterium]|nr:FAD-binding oxidoreductase [Myxococcaceae bacterium]
MSSERRAGTDADAVLGAIPRWVYSPKTTEEAREVIEATAAETLSLGFIGGGTDVQLGAPMRQLDALLQTGGLSRVVEYAPADMIVTVEAGTTLAKLSETLQQHRQRLPLDPPALDRATVGGAIAANSFGPRRARFGSVRDLLIGISIVRADGTRARGGGKVVKNVAGFDIPKLMCGSLGTLGLIVTATFRLHPLPEMEKTVLVRSRTAAQVRGLVARLKAGQLEPTSIVALSAAAARFDVAVRFEGFGAGVTQQAARFAELQQREGEPCEQLDDVDAQAWWKKHDDARTKGAIRAKIAALPNALETFLPKLEAVREHLVDSILVWYASLGLGFICGASSDLAAASRALADARSALEKANGSLTLQAAPQAIREWIGAWGTPPPAFSVMHRLKERFDPQQRLNPGRFVGGL